MKNAKMVLKCIAVVSLLAILCMIAGCSPSHKCDWCGKEFTGDVYYCGISASDQAGDACRECAARYWAPFSPDGYKKK